MHLQGSQAGVLLGAVFAVEGWACRDFGGWCVLQRGTVGALVVGHLMMRQCRETGVTVTAVQTVVDVLEDIWAGRI